jgi:hypothetical protein
MKRASLENERRSVQHIISKIKTTALGMGNLRSFHLKYEDEG